MLLFSIANAYPHVARNLFVQFAVGETTVVLFALIRVVGCAAVGFKDRSLPGFLKLEAR